MHICANMAIISGRRQCAIGDDWRDYISVGKLGFKIASAPGRPRRRSFFYVPTLAEHVYCSPSHSEQEVKRTVCVMQSNSALYIYNTNLNCREGVNSTRFEKKAINVCMCVLENYMFRSWSCDSACLDRCMMVCLVITPTVDDASLWSSYVVVVVVLPAKRLSTLPDKHIFARTSHTHNTHTHTAADSQTLAKNTRPRQARLWVFGKKVWCLESWSGIAFTLTFFDWVLELKTQSTTCKRCTAQATKRKQQHALALSEAYNCKKTYRIGTCHAIKGFLR